MKNIFLGLGLLSSLAAVAEHDPAFDYVLVDVGLRNPELLAEVEHSVSQELLNEDEGVESRIVRVKLAPRISEIGKLGRVAKHLVVLSEYKTRDYITNTNRPVFPLRESEAFCETHLRKDSENHWTAQHSDCEINLIVEE